MRSPGVLESLRDRGDPACAPQADVAAAASQTRANQGPSRHPPTPAPEPENTMSAPASTDEIIDDPPELESPVAALVRIASKARFFRSADGKVHAQIPLDSRDEIDALRSAAFRHWLIEAYMRDSGAVPSNWAVRRVIDALEALVPCNGDAPAVYVHVGRAGDDAGSSFYLDLGDQSGQAVKIGPEGWSVVVRPGVPFRRPLGMVPLPVPSRGGSIELLKPYVNVTDAEFQLLIAWIAAAIRPFGPYPILAVHGEQGSAKSTLAKIVRLLIDPQASPLLAEPRSTRDLMITAVNGWLLAYDNISAIPTWLSDSLCRLAVGGGFACRTPFSTDDRSVIHAQRPVILNGIEDSVRRADLADRAVFLNLPPLLPSSRRSEEQFWTSFHGEYPRILGAVLDAVVAGLRELPSVHLPELPRMADYARMGEAVGRGLGWPAQAFLAAYSDNRREATLTALENSVLGSMLLELSSDWGLKWSVTPTEAFRDLTRDVDRRTIASGQWPKSIRSFSDELRRLAPQLRMHGLSVTFSRTRDRRLITFQTIDCDAAAASHATLNGEMG